MDYYVWSGLGMALFVAGEVVVGCQGVEDLAGFREVGFEREDAERWVRKFDEVEVEDLEAC